MTSTIAAVLVKTGQPLQILDLEMPPLKPGQVLVDLAWSGVCGSQLLEARGRRGPDRFLPHTLGHEGAGIVAEVGPGVQKVRPGDSVVLSWIKGTGLDVPGTVYGSSLGPVNSGAISTFMRRTVTCENRLTPIPPGTSLREAALLGCAVPTGAGIVLNTLAAREGTSLAIFGLGGIGMSALLGAVARGLTPIVAVDVQPIKLQLALERGATHVVDARSQNPVEMIRALTGGAGVDFAIEAAGRTTSMESAYASVRPGGGVCVIAGNASAGETVRLDPMDLIRGRQIQGTWGGETQPDRDIPRFLDLAASGRLSLASLVSHSMPLERINEALDLLESGEAGRILVELGA